MAFYNQYIPDIHNGLIAKAWANSGRAFMNVQRDCLEFTNPNPSVITGVLEADIGECDWRCLLASACP